MSIPWHSLKLRLALAVALLMSLSVAITVLHAVRETRLRATQSVLESNLGVGQVAAALSARVIERQRALSAAAAGWPAGTAPQGPQAEAFLARQAVLRTLFDRVLVVPAEAFPAAQARMPGISAPRRDLPGSGTGEILLTVPMPGAGPPALLAGALSLRVANVLSDAARPKSVGEAALQTIVADSQGRVLAHADLSRLLGRIDDEPRLRQTVAKWRLSGSPLEPAPWTEQTDGDFVAMAAVPGTDWMVFRMAPAEALLGGASRSILRTAATGVAVGLLGAAAIFLVTARFLRPMTRLRHRALRTLDPAQSAHEGWPEGGDEVGQLSQVLRHVSEQLAASRAAMQQSLRHMQAVLDHAPTGIAFTTDGHFRLVSREFERMLGYEKGGLDGSSWQRLLPQPSEDLRRAARSASHEGRIFDTELQLRRHDGTPLWTQVQCTVLCAGDAAQDKIWIVADATDARRQRERLLWSAARDPLTELFNRREFEQQLRTLVADRLRHAPACALFIDLDHFKQVNDNAGHGAGDALLKRLAQAVQQRVRGDDVVARLGGDEFAVLLRGCELGRALQIAEAIRAEVQAQGRVQCAPQGVTASIGVVQIDGSLVTLSAVLEAADRACYAAKRAGRNLVRAASAEHMIAVTD